MSMETPFKEEIREKRIQNTKLQRYSLVHFYTFIIVDTSKLAFTTSLARHSYILQRSPGSGYQITAHLYLRCRARHSSQMSSLLHKKNICQEARVDCKFSMTQYGYRDRMMS